MRNLFDMFATCLVTAVVIIVAIYIGIGMAWLIDTMPVLAILLMVSVWTIIVRTASRRTRRTKKHEGKKSV